MTPLEVLKLLVATAETGHETGHTEAEVIAGNWDVLGPKVRATIRKQACRCIVGPEWSGSVNPNGLDNEWICDDCGRVIPATGDQS